MDGILIINKEEGWTSHDVVAKVKGLTKEKVGHIGTLDPLATGVLPLLLGKGTKLSKYLIEHDKIYEVELKLGKRTNTGDSEGKVIENIEVDEKILTNQNIMQTLENFLGEQIQTPPIYSAIKVKGKKLYEYARENKEVEIPKRKINILEIGLINFNIENKTIQFRVHCSKGTYIRTLCEDIAKKLGTIGYMTSLRRLSVGNFNIMDAIKISELEKNINDKEFIINRLITIEDFFENNNIIEIDLETYKKFLNGVKLESEKEDGIYKIIVNENFVGLGIVQNAKLKRELILND